MWRHWLVDLARKRTFVRYDERGCGLSDHDVSEFSLDAYVQDLETVVDDLGLDRFPLLGVSQGGAVAVTYAARHPERVSKLVLCGAYLQGRVRRATTDESRREGALHLEMLRIGWDATTPVPSLLHVELHPGCLTRAVGVVRRAAPANNVGAKCSAVGRVVVRDGCH